MARSLNRRVFTRRLALTGVAAAMSGMAAPAVIGAGRPRVVVIGGGAGGASVAHKLASSGAVDVTLVEPKARYSTCFFGNYYLGGLRDFDSITHDYQRLQGMDKLRVVQAMAQDVDTAARSVRLPDGERLAWDRLVLAPGIDFRWDAIEGYGMEAVEQMPHAYRGGAELRTLKARIEGVPDGGRFIMVPPPNPYRCPPGPYERVSMIAHWFSRHRPKAKILILDPKDAFSKQALFQRAWAQHYPGMVEWLPGGMLEGGVTAVRPQSMEVVTPAETFTADAVNLIPPQKAGLIAHRAGLVDDSGWCPVDAASFASTRAEGVHLVGDAIIAGDMPKSAFSANSQARVCVNAILADLAGSEPPEPGFANTCWSLVAPDDAVKVGASYAVVDGKISSSGGFLSELDDPQEVRFANARDAEGWYEAITQEMFG